MNTKGKHSCGYCNRAMQQPSAEPKITRRVRLLVNALCAARGGGAQMTLSDWRDVEREVERKLQYRA